MTRPKYIYSRKNPKNNTCINYSCAYCGECVNLNAQVCYVDDDNLPSGVLESRIGLYIPKTIYATTVNAQTNTKNSLQYQYSTNYNGSHIWVNVNNSEDTLTLNYSDGLFNSTFKIPVKYRLDFNNFTIDDSSYFCDSNFVIDYDPPLPPEQRIECSNGQLIKSISYARYLFPAIGAYISGVEWKPGYPNLLGDAPRYVLQDVASVYHVCPEYENDPGICNIPSSAPKGHFTESIFRVVRWDFENKSWEDVTAESTTLAYNVSQSDCGLTKQNSDCPDPITSYYPTMKYVTFTYDQICKESDNTPFIS